MLGGVLAVLAAMMPVTAFSFDEKAKWDKYALSMPVSRRDLVLSKYIFGLGFCVLAFAVNMVFNSLLDSGNKLKETLIISYALFAVSLPVHAADPSGSFSLWSRKGQTSDAGHIVCSDGNCDAGRDFRQRVAG